MLGNIMLYFLFVLFPIKLNLLDVNGSLHTNVYSSSENEKEGKYKEMKKAA